MLTVRLFLVILVTLLCRELSWDAPFGLASALFSVSIVCVGFGAIAKLLCVMNLSRVGGLQSEGVLVDDPVFDRWHAVRESLETFWILCLPLTLLVTGWGSSIRQLDEAGLLQSISVVMWFLPSLIALVLLELTTSQLEVHMQSVRSRASAQWQIVIKPQFEADGRRSSLVQVRYPEQEVKTEKSIRSLGKVLATRLRLGSTSSVSACLLPVLVIAIASDVLSLLEVGWTESVQSSVASVVGLATVALFMPQWMGAWMGVQSLEGGPLRERILSYCRMLKIGCRPMLVRSEGRWAGAAVVGWFPGNRQLWLGDGLLDQLSDEEVDMVVMHELAHLARRHFVWRMLPVVLAGILGAGAMAVAASGEGAMGSVLMENGGTAKLAWQTIGIALAACVMLFGLSFVSRTCELDADRYACELGAKSCEWAAGEREVAADRLARALMKLHRRSPEEDRATWLHPSLGQRLANLPMIGALEVNSDGNGRQERVAIETLTELESAT